MNASYTSTQTSRHAHGSWFPVGSILPFLLVTSLFFLWGIPNNLNDVLIRQFMKSFAISRFQAGLVQSAFYMGYFLLALPSALYMRKVGYKVGIITGLLLFGVGTFLFAPAALVQRYSFFLLALFIMASGLAFLETAANSFIALLGSPETSERRLNFSQAFNPIGSIVGALVGTIFIFSGVELSSQKVVKLQQVHQYKAYMQSETLRVVRPYVALGIVAIAFAIGIMLVKFPVLRDEGGSQHEEHADLWSLLRNRHLLITLFAQFFYVGAQVGTWSYFIQYVQQYGHQSEKIAGYFLTSTLAMFCLGRFVSSYLMKFITPPRLMGIYSVINAFLVVLAIAHRGWLGVWCIFITSFFMSLMYPTIFALGIHDLGANTKVGGSFIVMAIVGGAVLTPLMGLISETSYGLAAAYVVPLVAYLIIGAYSFTLANRIGRRLPQGVGMPVTP